MTQKKLTDDLVKTAERWCEMLDGMSEADVRTVDTVIKTAALIRANDGSAAKTDKPA